LTNNEASSAELEAKDDMISNDGEAQEGLLMNSNTTSDAVDYSKSSPYDLDMQHSRSAWG